ncbi:S-methyl-5-thioribose-1-phosphate isomerase [Candidatus Bathyarchaeota archaeon ex4484_205]|nr:MAG: S-methyl-5-thioribose-1-phosphate isomerase [Candidatus Bathyarchaeota archaeon ex4484_205]RLG69180.1 MAG: S-methyl-5-thioribose-1-phosphate isomerase [archaeon]
MEKTLLEKVIKKMGLTEGELGLPQHPKTTLPLTLWYDHEREELILLDQNRLPFEETVWTTKNWKDAAWKGIKEMTVRGSQAIGVTGAYALLLAALSTIDFEEELKKRAYEISHVRPTAAPLSWAVERCLERGLTVYKEAGRREAIEAIREEANYLMAEDLVLNFFLRREGRRILKDGDVIMTHCNGGSLSSTLMGHALGMIEEAYVEGVELKVVAKETRPRSQGYRLTVWELLRTGVPTTIVTDNMISIAMEKLGVNKVIVGVDRVARDGSVANKVGTSDIAKVAKFYDVEFYFATGYSTISLSTPSGRDIEIEERNISEVTQPYTLLGRWLKSNGKTSKDALEEWPPSERIVGREPESGEVRIFNPAFDVTPPELITAIITDIGIFKPEEILNLTDEFMRKKAEERMRKFLEE